MSLLVQKLSQGEHPVEIALRPEPTLARLKECIERGYVHLKFVDTRGGTELGIRLDMQASSLDADFEKGIGHIKLVGSLILDYVKVNCVADIDISSFTGTGHLTLV